MHLRHRLFLTLLLAPALLVLGAIVLLPFLANFVVALSNADGHLTNWGLIGFGNFVSIFQQPLLWSLLVKSIIWTVASLVFHVGIGVLLAVLLHQQFVRGKAAWRVALILPWALPPYIGALTWRGMFNHDYGSVNLFLTKYLHLAPVQWLSSPFEAFLAVIIANIWLGFPFMMLVALAGLQTIPDELYEAAEVDGASTWSQFWHITLPMLRPVMLPAISLGGIWTFNNLQVIWLISHGGEPADSTHTLLTYVYKAAFTMERFGWAAAFSVIVFALLFLASQLLPKRRSFEAA